MKLEPEFTPTSDTPVFDALVKARTPDDYPAERPYTPQHAAGAPSLAGLIAEHPAARKRVYYAYAIAALVVSFGPDVVIAGVVAGDAVEPFTAWVGLASSVLLKIGTAFGFVAAANVKA